MSSKFTLRYTDAATAEHVTRCLDNDPELTGFAVEHNGNHVHIEPNNALLDGLMSLVGYLASSIVSLLENIAELTGARPALREADW